MTKIEVSIEVGETGLFMDLNYTPGEPRNETERTIASFLTARIKNDITRIQQTVDDMFIALGTQIAPSVTMEASGICPE